MKRPLVYIGYAALTLAGVLVVLGVFRVGPVTFFNRTFKVLSSDDEAPIIVKNGSMDFELPSAHAGEWQDNNNAAWSYESPSDKVHKNDFWVRVDLKGGGTCTGKGHVVMIDYSATSFRAIFTPGKGVDGSTLRTQVTPKADIAFVDKQHLRHGAEGDGGYIQDVKVDGRSVKNGQADCAITQANLVQVNICSNPNKCQ